MQSSFSELEYANKKRVMRRDRFPAEIEAVTSWPALVSALERSYPKGDGRGRPPIGLGYSRSDLISDNLSAKRSSVCSTPFSSLLTNDRWRLRGEILATCAATNIARSSFLPAIGSSSNCSSVHRRHGRPRRRVVRSRRRTRVDSLVNSIGNFSGVRVGRFFSSRVTGS